MQHILTINPGSTSTKIAIFKLSDKNSGSLQQIAEKNVEHDSELLKKYRELSEQIELRTACILNFVEQHKIEHLDCIVSRGGLIHPVSAGSYAINQQMIDDLTHNRYGTHASNLGALIADKLGKKFNCSTMIVDSVSVDELTTLARYSGLPEIERRSQTHALNIRATARLAAQDLGVKMESANFIVAHLGGGISVVPLENGHIIDTNNALDGGPFSPQRTGTLPVTQLATLAYSGRYKNAKELIYKLTKESGLLAYLGTDSGKKIVERINNGDKHAEEVFRAMGYQIAKEIGAMATVLRGKVNAILVTGGLARPPLTDWLQESVDWIAPLLIYPGEREQEALAEAGARFLCGEEQLQHYS